MTKSEEFDHWRFFSEFARWELASGGPDPQLVMAYDMSRGVPKDELVWRAGCYISVYNVPSAEAIWREWSWDRIQTEPEKLLPWLESNWAKIQTRIERRCIRRPDWLCEFFSDYVEFAHDFADLYEECAACEPLEAYEIAWQRSLRVSRLGRYVSIKLLEFLRRYLTLPIETPDIRPNDGWSPRRSLATLWPDEAGPGFERSNDPEDISLVNEICQETVERLGKRFDINIDLFQLQVLLCEYRESWEGKRQYPGRSLDSELKYALECDERWGCVSEIWETRKRLFPEEHLGELHGWRGPRKDCAHALADMGYTWTDLKYDYSKSLDLRNPEVREGQTAPLERSKPPKSKPKQRSKKGNRPTVHIILDEASGRGRLLQSSRWNLMTVEEGRALAKELGVTGLANFWKDDDKTLAGMFDWYEHIPLQDGMRISTSLAPVVEKICNKIRAGDTIVSMCYGGRNRSGLISALVVRDLLGCSGAEAVGVVQSVYPGALKNLHFREFLEGLSPDDSLKKGLLF